MAHRLSILPALLAACTLASCTSVVSKTPVGAEPAPLDPKQWNGQWMNSEKMALYILVTDPEKGRLEIAYVEESNGRLKLKTHPVEIRKGSEWLWANSQMGDDNTWFFGRIKEPEDGELLCWLARPEGFMDAVRSGKLKGELPKASDGKESGSVLLEGLSKSDIEALEKGTYPKAFVWDSPLVLIRMRP